MGVNTGNALFLRPAPPSLCAWAHVDGCEHRKRVQNAELDGTLWGGAGGVSGLYTALTGAHLPGGVVNAVAEGNALGKGPVVFEFKQSSIRWVRRCAAGELPFGTASSLHDPPAPAPSCLPAQPLA